MSAQTGGGGVGADVLLFGSKRLLLQPSVGLQRVNPSQPEFRPDGRATEQADYFQAAGQLSIMLAL